ncbi:MAG: DUF262 domain-containing protein [Desulfosporosinus sp.]|nr:DUF262 domain-containing protein [Desulfosporosinus sp.]
MDSKPVQKLVQWLINQNKKNLLDLSIPIQRNQVWNDIHKSNLVVSILNGFPVESLLFEESSIDKSFKVLDGKQRILTIIQFANNEFKLSAKSKAKDSELQGKTFQNLTPEQQEQFSNYQITITMVRDLSEADRELLFFMRNQAVSLSTLELTRALIGSQVLARLKDLINHPFLQETIGLSKNALNKYTDQQILIQFLILEMKKEATFSGAEIMEFADGILKKEGVLPEIEEKVNLVMTFLQTSMGEDFKGIKRIHIPMLYLVGCNAIEQGKSPEFFHDWMIKFFKDIDQNGDEYKLATGAGSAQKQNVDKREKYIRKHFEDYLAQ